MSFILDKYKDAIVQVATPFNFGSGFILKSHAFIITNYHIIKNNKEVIISGRAFGKKSVKVLFIDKLLDIALLEKPTDLESDYPTLSLTTVSEGEQVFAIGHPMRLKYSVTSGIISKTDRELSGIKLIQIDAPLNPGNSGGPLFNKKAEVVGLNTMVIKDAENIGFSIPSQHISETLNSYNEIAGKPAIRCYSCRKIQIIDEVNNGYCCNCGYKFSKEEYKPSEFKPQGMVAKIEDIIYSIGYDAKLARSGPFFWEIEISNLLIKVIYLNNSKLIIFDVSLCLLPEDNIAEFYEFLLKENYSIKNHTFNLKNNEILISFIIFEDDFNYGNCLELVNQLIEYGKQYIVILQERFMAKPVEQ